MSSPRHVIPYVLVAVCLGAGGTPLIAQGALNTPVAPAISGTVVDASGRAVQGARVALVPMGLFDPSGSRFVHVDSAGDGSFRFAGVGAGRYGVTATAPDHTAAWVADVEAGRAGLRLQLQLAVADGVCPVASAIALVVRARASRFGLRAGWATTAMSFWSKARPTAAGAPRFPMVPTLQMQFSDPTTRPRRRPCRGIAIL